MRISIRLSELLMAAALIILGSLLLGTAQAQTGCEDTGDGPVDQTHSGVKRVGDTFTVSWAAPTELADANCTPIASDPAFAITNYEVYVEVDAPAQSDPAFPPVATLPASQTSFSGTLDESAMRPGSNVYYAVAACNQFGCSSLSAQKWHKLGGPPGKPQSVTIQ